MAILLLGVVFGIVINAPSLSGLDLVAKGAMDGMLLLTIPALLSAISIKLMIYKMPFKRITATTLLGELIYAITYGSGFFLASSTPLYSQLIIVFGAALVFVLWYTIARLIFVLKYRSLLFAGIQLLFHVAFLLSSSILYFDSGLPLSIAKFYIAALILLGALYLFFFVINAPMKRNIGISSTDAIALFASQWLYNSKEIEKTFERIGEHAKTMVGVMAFRRKNGMVLFVVPYVHFGPFGNLGGSEFSSLLPKALSKKHDAETFVFHATVTHDLNPISSSELRPLVDACNSSLKGAEFKPAKVALSIGRFSECEAQMLKFNDDAFISLTRAPEVTEDVDFGVGLAMMAEAEKNVRSAIMVDQHNSETGKLAKFMPGDEVCYNYLQAVKRVSEQQSASSKLMVGVATAHADSGLIGDAGIKVAAISSSPLSLLVVIDCNGITPDFRDTIISELKGSRKDVHVSVFTTDTHKVNSVRGVLNPLRADGTVLEIIKTSAKRAIADMQPAEFYSDKVWFETEVVGARQSIEIISTINSIIAVSKIILPMFIIGGILAILFFLGSI